MGTKCIIGMFRKGNRLFRQSIGWVFSTRILFIDYKQNKLQKYKKKKYRKVYFWFAKKIEILFPFILAKVNVVMPSYTCKPASTRGVNLYKGRNDAIALLCIVVL